MSSRTFKILLSGIVIGGLTCFAGQYADYRYKLSQINADKVDTMIVYNYSEEFSRNRQRQSQIMIVDFYSVCTQMQEIFHHPDLKNGQFVKVDCFKVSDLKMNEESLRLTSVFDQQYPDYITDIPISEVNVISSKLTGTYSVPNFLIEIPK